MSIPVVFYFIVSAARHSSCYDGPPEGKKHTRERERETHTHTQSLLSLVTHTSLSLNFIQKKWAKCLLSYNPRRSSAWWSSSKLQGSQVKTICVTCTKNPSHCHV
jgi:hypothetical protein